MTNPVPKSLIKFSSRRNPFEVPNYLSIFVCCHIINRGGYIITRLRLSEQDTLPIWVNIAIQGIFARVGLVVGIERFGIIALFVADIKSSSFLLGLIGAHRFPLSCNQAARSNSYANSLT